MSLESNFKLSAKNNGKRSLTCKELIMRAHPFGNLRNIVTTAANSKQLKVNCSLKPRRGNLIQMNKFNHNQICKP